MALVLLLAACSAPATVERPAMAPIDTPSVPKAAKAECTPPAWEPISLPTDAAEQIEARHRDQAKAETVIAECDQRRAAAVRAIRRR
ncbi:hypothetical protein AB4Z01_15105 [Inquilinus sp. YAF38]|uniref:hypothetical protein n=1 Tax=Inquilinus sp. YAF38 TaxID=3233084 RepID=UPI003F92B881